MMREDLRRDCTAIWVIDCTPEGHQPEVATRIFEGVQQPVCIVLAVRTPGKDRAKPGDVYFRTMPEARRAEKFKALGGYSLFDPGWVKADSEWTAPFLPAHGGEWGSFHSLSEFFEWSSPGIKTHRTWIIAPDRASLVARWGRANQGEESRKEGRALPHRSGQNPEQDRQLAAWRSSDEPDPDRTGSRGNSHSCPLRLQVFRPAMDTAGSSTYQPSANKALGKSRGQTTLFDRARRQLSVKRSRADSFRTCARQRPLQRLVRRPRVPALARRCRDGAEYPGGASCRAFDDLRVRGDAGGGVCYVAALLANPAYTEKFQADLKRPGLRVPLTADAGLFREAAELGRSVIWLHCYGERFADPTAGRPPVRRAWPRAKGR